MASTAAETLSDAVLRDFLPMGAQLIARGAESVVYVSTFLARPAILKLRVPKRYRHPILDVKLTSRRLLSEARIVARLLRAGLDVPCVYAVDAERGLIVFERIAGRTVKEILFSRLAATDQPAASGHSVPLSLVTPVSEGLVQEQQIRTSSSSSSSGPEAAELLMASIGSALAVLHDLDVVHGDLTTSNMMVRDTASSPARSASVPAAADEPVGAGIVLIDFGLSFSSTLSEDKAVDLYVLERAFLSTHPNSARLFELILQQYKMKSRKSGAVLAKLEQVRLRGRKRSMVG